jgi:histidine phosphotransferase ChpT
MSDPFAPYTPAVHAGPATAAEISALDLAALIASRVCHDIISPVGAIANGLEVLEEDKENDEMRAFAMDLIRKSARQASAKLQFCRIAFGAAGSAGSEIDLGEAEKVAKGFVANEKPELVWNAERAYLPKNQVKLLLNLVMAALGAVPRGGTITVDVRPGPEFTLTCVGPSARVPPNLEAFLMGDLAGHGLDSHAIQPVYAGLLARAAGMTARVVKDGEAIVLSATKIS